MPQGDRKRIAVIGAGPIGLEAALYGVNLGHDVRVYERGSVGDHIRQWGHVRLFSPWALERSRLGVAEIERAGLPLEPGDAHPTGEEYVERYLEPLARSAALDGRIEERCRVIRVGRSDLRKGELIGGPRDENEFRLFLDSASGERVDTADVVFDASGVYGNPNWMGNGNLPALGERGLRDRIDYRIPDIAGAERGEFVGKRVLVVGAGHSAATSLDALLSVDDVDVVWATRETGTSPLVVIQDDPLPDRARLSIQSNRLACGEDPRVRFLGGRSVDRIDRHGAGFRVDLSAEDRTRETVEVDRVLAHVGYGPDRSLYRELQVHECYATMGPYALAATLLSSGSTDCLAQTSPGPDALRNPEPNFFVLGAKSYGRNPDFLIRVGLEQVRDAYTLVEGRPELDLYAA